MLFDVTKRAAPINVKKRTYKVAAKLDDDKEFGKPLPDSKRFKPNPEVVYQQFNLNAHMHQEESKEAAAMPVDRDHTGANIIQNMADVTQ